MRTKFLQVCVILLTFFGVTPTAFGSQIYSEVYENDFGLTDIKNASSGIVQSTIVPSQVTRSDMYGSISQSAAASALLSGNSLPTIRIKTDAQAVTLPSWGCPPNTPINVCTPPTGPPLGDSEIRAFAFVYDGLSVSNAPSNGSFKFSYQISGTVGQANTAPAGSNPFNTGAVNLLAVANPASITPPAPSNDYYDTDTPPWVVVNKNAVYSLGTNNYSTASSLLVPYVNGTASYQLGLLSYSECQTSVPGSCQSYSDFSNTLKITSLEVLDSTGHVVSGARVQSESGVNYLNLPTDTPEPTPLFLVAGSLALLIALRRIIRPAEPGA